MSCLTNRIAIVFFRRHHSLLPLRPVIRFSSKDHLVSTEDHEFLSWIQQKAGTEISSALSLGRSIYGRSLFASKFIHAGDCLLKVPYSLHITPQNMISEVAQLIPDSIGKITQVAMVLLAEKKLGEDSEWAPYITSLPPVAEMHNTIFWSRDELEMIQKSSLYQETINVQSCINREFSAVRLALERFRNIFGDCTFEDFMHAYALVASRAWGTTNGLSLIPFADFLNHDGLSDAVLLSDEEKEISEVIADRDYAIGEQVLIRYGKFPNSTLLLDFGFTLPFNTHDQVQIWVDVPLEDPLCTMKLDLLHRHRMPMLTSINGSGSSGNSFTIREVRSCQGKGKGIPQSLRAFARVLSIESPEELKDLEAEAAEHDGRLGRRPLKNMENEIKANQILISKISHMIQSHDASIKSLNSFSCANGGPHDLRRRMAEDLLAGELRVLKSALAWLVNYNARLFNSKATDVDGGGS